MQTADGNGITIDAKDSITTALSLIRGYLAGTLMVAGATIKGGQSLALHLVADGEGLILKVTGQRPKVMKAIGPLSLTGELDRIVLTETDMRIVVDGLPDVTIKVT